MSSEIQKAYLVELARWSVFDEIGGDTHLLSITDVRHSANGNLFMFRKTVEQKSRIDFITNQFYSQTVDSARYKQNGAVKPIAAVRFVEI